LRVQSELFTLGAELATVPGKEDKLGIALIAEPQVEALEAAIDAADAALPALKTFVLPGGSEAAATLHLARTVCRRAERALVALSAREPVRPELVRYLNRLSDLLVYLRAPGQPARRRRRRALGSSDLVSGARSASTRVVETLTDRFGRCAKAHAATWGSVIASASIRLPRWSRLITVPSGSPSSTAASR
jgi:ATP:cob(I)alamin adenosyltransferase